MTTTLSVPAINILYPPRRTAVAQSIFSADATDEFLEAGELLLDDVDRGLVLELERLFVEFLLRHADEDLRPIEHEPVEKYHALAQVILHASAAERTPSGRLQCDRLVGKRLVLQAGDPINCVLETAGNRVIV